MDGGAAVACALTGELLRSLRDQCAGGECGGGVRAPRHVTAVFRSVFGRLAALTDAINAAISLIDDQEAETERLLGYGRARESVVSIVETVRGALAAEALTLSRIPGTAFTDSGHEEGDEADRFALRAIAVASIRAKFARDLHQRISCIASRWETEVTDEPEQERELSCEAQGKEEEASGWRDGVLEWEVEWEADWRAQVDHYHTVLDQLESVERQDSVSSTDTSPPVEMLSRLVRELEDSPMDNKHRGLLRRALGLLVTAPNIRCLVSSPDEQERWRRLSAAISELSWRPVYEPFNTGGSSHALSVRNKAGSSASVSISSNESPVVSTSSGGGGGTKVKPPKWLIPAHEVTFIDELTDESRRARGIIGRWLDADVLLKPIRDDASGEIARATAKGSSPLVAEIERWHRLGHPYVAKLFGVFHDGEQSFCVCEYEEWGALDEFAQFADDIEVWQLLYEAALGLRFLHARGIVHGNLRPSSIVVDPNGSANIDGVGTRSAVIDSTTVTDYCFDDEVARWAAPECLRGASGSFESDVYSFGIVVVGEFLGSGRLPWGNEEFSIVTAKQVAEMGTLPPRPQVLSNAEWTLITQMCAFEPEKRPSMKNALESITTFMQSLTNGLSEVERFKQRTWERVYKAGEDLQYQHDELRIFNGVLTSLKAAQLVPTISSSRNRKPLLTFPTREAALATSTAGHLSLRWRAPETLRGEDSTFASDVYSFGIRIIEALTRDYAWGSRTPDIVAGDAIVHGQLPYKPSMFSDGQWNLVERMCALDPDARPSMSTVVTELHQFAYYQKEFTGRDESSVEGRISSDSVTDLDNNSRDDDNRQDNVDSMVLPAIGLRIGQLLQDLRDLVEEGSESVVEANANVLKRFQDIYDRAFCGKSVASAGEAAVTAFCDVLVRFWQFVNQNTSRRSSLSSSGLSFEFDSNSFAASASRSCVRNNFVFHRELDVVLSQLCIPSRPSLESATLQQVHDWRAKWYNFRSSQLHRQVGTSSAASTATNGWNELTEGDECEDKILATRREGNSKILRRGNSGSAPPAWFIWPYDVIFDELKLLGRGSFGSVHKATWLGAPVVVKKILSGFETDSQRGIFDREVSIWHRLHHPHIIKLYGACHVGQPFFVCEFALYGRLDKYLSHRETQQHNDESFSRVRLAWEKILEACLGLQYLHERGVIHADLKCDNILVAMDGKAKLSDFGLSLIAKRSQTRQRQDSDTLRLGAIRWKAPEVLTGNSPSTASDIYGMAMCLIEAVTGIYPWGNSIPDASVAFQAKQGILPNQPEEFSAAEWQIVEAMCRLDPSRRLCIGDVVKALAERVRLDKLRSTTLA
jgi:serine/threonine protein kinase